MARVAVICGTGMSELTNDFRRKKDCTITELKFIPIGVKFQYLL